MSQKEVNKAKQDIETFKQKLFELRLSLWQGSAKVDTSQFKKLRKEVARLKTKFKL